MLSLSEVELSEYKEVGLRWSKAALLVIEYLQTHPRAELHILERLSKQFENAYEDVKIFEEKIGQKVLTS